VSPANRTRLGVVILAVKSLRASADFYASAFGWTRLVDVPVYVEFALPGDLRLGLYQEASFGVNTGQRPAERAPGSLSGAELYFYPDDLVEVSKRLAAAGARMLDPLRARDWGDEAAYFADPDGHVIVLARPLPGTGAVGAPGQGPA
jgi:lactoylglutathione lyase